MNSKQKHLLITLILSHVRKLESYLQYNKISSSEFVKVVEKKEKLFIFITTQFDTISIGSEGRSNSCFKSAIASLNILRPV